MKTKSATFVFLAGFALALFVACDFQRVETIPAPPIQVGEGQTRFFAFYPTLREITAPDEIGSRLWDFALYSRAGNRRTILTNSGVTAGNDATLGRNSGGQGEVWHTGRFTLSGINETHRAATRDDLRIDRVGYVQAAMGGGITRRVFNVMNYPGWTSGTGASAANPFYGPLHNQNQFHGPMGPGMPPVFNPTGRVFIIQHGCGVCLSALQVFGYRSGPPEVYILLYRHLEVASACTARNL